MPVLKVAAELAQYYALCRGVVIFCPRVAVAYNGHIFHSSYNGSKNVDHRWNDN